MASVSVSVTADTSARSASSIRSNSTRGWSESGDILNNGGVDRLGEALTRVRALAGMQGVSWLQVSPSHV